MPPLTATRFMLCATFLTLEPSKQRYDSSPPNLYTHQQKEVGSLATAFHLSCCCWAWVFSHDSFMGFAIAHHLFLFWNCVHRICCSSDHFPIAKVERQEDRNYYQRDGHPRQQNSIFCWTYSMERPSTCQWNFAQGTHVLCLCK